MRYTTIEVKCWFLRVFSRLSLILLCTLQDILRNLVDPPCRRYCMLVLYEPWPASLPSHQFNVKVLSSEYAKYYFHLR